MPDNRKVCKRDKVLSDCSGTVEVKYNVPPSSRHKDRLTRPLENLNLVEGEMRERERERQELAVL